MQELTVLTENYQAPLHQAIQEFENLEAEAGTACSRTITSSITEHHYHINYCHAYCIGNGVDNDPMGSKTYCCAFY